MKTEFHLKFKDENNNLAYYFCSLLYEETTDHPGLLVDLVNVITDINIAIESGEFDTIVIISHSPLRVLNILLLFFL